MENFDWIYQLPRRSICRSYYSQIDSSPSWGKVKRNWNQDKDECGGLKLTVSKPRKRSRKKRNQRILKYSFKRIKIAIKNGENDELEIECTGIKIYPLSEVKRKSPEKSCGWECHTAKNA